MSAAMAGSPIEDRFRRVLDVMAQHAFDLFGHPLGDGLGQQVVRAHREVGTMGFDGPDGQDGQPTRRQDLTRLFSA